MLLSLSSTAWGQFSFQEISGLDNGMVRVSGDGKVVVGSVVSKGIRQAARWSPTTGITVLGSLPGGDTSSGAFGVSFDGNVIVGQASSANGTEAFRWTVASSMVGLGDLPGSGSFSSIGFGVSADGSVVVGHSTRSWPVSRAFRWTAATGITDLGDLLGGANVSSASAVTPDGSVIVGRGLSAVTQEAFRWTAVTGFVGLGHLPGGSGSQANAVSADGKVVVGMGVNARGDFEAFRWTQGGGMVGLGSINPLDFASSAAGVSADGTVIVGIGSGAADFNGEAFVWFPSGIRDLRKYLLANGVTAVQGWRLVEASSISADGKTLCGIGLNPQGKGAVWLAHIEVDNTPPAPPPPDQTETFVPTGITVSTGVQVTGGVAQIQASDNAYLTIQTTGNSAILMPIFGQASRATASELRFSVESATEGASTRQEITLYDWMARQWVSVNTRTLTSSDSTTEVRITDRPSRFIDPVTLRLQSRVTLTPSGGRKAKTKIRVDRVAWTRVP
jgi:probable HAF family extracellular repeat protein